MRAYAKINLALVVGPLRPDGKHEVATVMQAIDLYDDIELEPATALTVEGFAEDTLVRGALEALASTAVVPPSWRVRIGKRIPVAAGLGGGSSDAAAALLLANAVLAKPLKLGELDEIAARLGADVPFFLRGGSQLATGDGTDLEPLELPDDYCVLLVRPEESKKSTRAVYHLFDDRGGAAGFDGRRGTLLEALGRVERSTDLASLPKNDLASSPVAVELERLGAFRADVTGAGPVVYGLFEHAEDAEGAAAALAATGQTWIVRPIA
ncbi:MAG: 4-(cytidine 5'-diphospho)-2-C-methyl-D-erythritol kinase [Actinobacteria bacterium]|nr:4-(cytidine 5'-diphospho)-2-C-methyl-D-erythritol kinase [Actinomycetota bacterium]